MNNLPELRKIIAEAPEGATHASKKSVYYKFNQETPYESMVWWVRGGEWIEAEIDHLTRSLADIRTIVEQANRIADLEHELSNYIGHSL